MLLKNILRKEKASILLQQISAYGFLCCSGFSKRLRNGEVFVSLPDKSYRDGA